MAADGTLDADERAQARSRSACGGGCGGSETATVKRASQLRANDHVQRTTMMGQPTDDRHSTEGYYGG